MEYDLPKDPMILLSYVNTQLRDHYESFDEMCLVKLYNKDEIVLKLKAIDYEYNVARNQFL